MKKFKPATPKFPHILHGGDYNPEQWKDHPNRISEITLRKFLLTENIPNC